jgi:hypothetical protein
MAWCLVKHRDFIVIIIIIIIIVKKDELGGSGSTHGA